jgi:hypothetical protein
MPSVKYKKLEHEKDNLLCACPDCRAKKGKAILVPVSEAKRLNMMKGEKITGMGTGIKYYRYRLITLSEDGKRVFKYVGIA